jgi:hypothetical protein
MWMLLLGMVIIWLLCKHTAILLVLLLVVVMLLLLWCMVWMMLLPIMSWKGLRL